MNAKKIFREKDANDQSGPDCAVTHDRLFQQRFSVVTSEEHAYSDSGIAEVHRLREKIVREDITVRLREVCSNFSDDEFEQLVRLMAARQVRCERRQSW